MLHVEMAGKSRPLADKIPDILSGLAHILRSLVTIVRIVQRTVFQHVVFKIGGIELADKGTVHVERGDTVFHADEVGRLRVGHVLDIILQGRQRLAIVPGREVVLLLFHRGHYGVVVIAAA